MEEDIKNMSKEELLEYLEEISQQLDNIALDQIKIAIAELQYFKDQYKELEYKYDKALSDLVQAEQKNKELEEERQIVGMPVRNKRDGRIGIVLHQWKSGSVAVLESISPRVINTHDSWNTLKIVTDEVKQTQTKCETIPVSLVEETIEELSEDLEIMKVDAMYGRYKEYGSKLSFEKQFSYKYGMHDVLQELLEKRK